MADYDQEVTPEQIEMMRAYGEALRTPQRVGHPAMGIANILGALAGGANIQQAERLRLQQRRNLFSPSGAVSPRPAPRTTIGTAPASAPESTRSAAAPATLSDEFNRYAGAMDTIESGGNYALRGPVITNPRSAYRGDRAYGRFQVMGKDVPRLTQQHFGQQLTPEQFLSSQEAQNAVFQGEFGRLVQRFGNPIDAAQAWFAGEGTVGNPAALNRTDAQQGHRGTSVANYRRLFASALSRQGGAAPSNQNQIINRPVRTIPIGPDGRMNLGGPDAATPEAPTAPAAPAAPTPQPTAETPPAPTPATPERVAQASQQSTANLPAGTPPRIEPDPNIALLERQLQAAGTMGQDEARNVYNQYLGLVGPQARETPGGTAYYSGRDGSFLYLVPKMGNIPVQVPGVSTQQQYIMGPQGPQILQSSPFGGGANQSATGGVQNPNITPNPPPFPNTGNISELSAYGSNLEAQNEMARALAKGQASRVNAAIERSVTAPTALSTLNTIRTATEAANRALWRGPSLGDWTQRVSQYLSNFGLGSVEELRRLPYSELLTKLNSQLASQATQDLSARGTNFELDTFMRNFPSLSQSYEGAVMLLDYLQQEQRKAVEVGRLADNLQPNQMGNWTRIVQDYYNRNPIYLNMPAIGRPNSRGYQPPRKITTQTISTPEQARNLPRGVWFITPDGRLLPGGPE